MDSVLSKVGLYDFLGVLLTGMLSVISLVYLGLPTLSSSLNEGTLDVLSFILSSYFVGLILRELSSLIDRKFLKLHKNAESAYLTNGKIISNPLELVDFRKMANSILKKPLNNECFSEHEHRYLIKYCQMYLETRGKDGKYETMHSLYVMSRSLMLTYSCISLYYLFFVGTDVYHPLYQVVLVSLSILFFYRSKSFSKYRVRAILRHYRSLTRDD